MAVHSSFKISRPLDDKPGAGCEITIVTLSLSVMVVEDSIKAINERLQMIY